MCNAVPGDSIFFGGKFIPHESLGCRMKSLDFGLEAAISLCCTWPDYEMRHVLDRGVKGFTFSELKAGNFLSNSHFPGVWDSYFFGWIYVPKADFCILEMGFLFAWKLETRVHCAGVDFHVVQEIILGLWSWTQIILILLMHLVM